MPEDTAAKEGQRKRINELVAGFLARKYEYEAGDYLESALRQDFIDELFKELGWDVGNSKRLSQLEREVLVEKGDTKGRPDYAFRVNGEDRFFVEAKAHSKGTDKPEDIFQAKRYGWNTRKVNVVVLTDFNSFKVFDATLKPDVKHPSIGLLFDLKCENFASSDFEKLLLFSRQRVNEGSLDALTLKDATSKRLRIPVDVSFLEQMTEWREALAKDVFKNNPSLSVRALNDVVQRLLDRLVFIRILEDRKIIESRSLREISENWKEAKHRDIQPQLNALFKQLNEDFNGEIFKSHPCETATYDSAEIAEIIEQLYAPKSPYDFAVIGVDLLGIIYEKYLGKTIRLTEKRVKVEEKPEVRKAGGVYYTPKWVVRYITENTVGKLIEGKTPSEISKLRILDPACGSGSFLIGALELLLDYHLNYYLNHLKEAKHGTLFADLLSAKDDDGNVSNRLSIEKKGEILRNNIFGVDIDPQAVEITMMSLYIKVLEGERTLPHNKELLPSLSNNIRCGNSLIEFNYLEQKTLVQDSEKEHANPFEWRSKTTGFGNIIGEKGGFDAIIGNPPYIRIQTMKEWAPKEVEYFSKKYRTAASGNYDIYVVFVERAIQLLGEKGLFGFIMPHKFFQAQYGENLRKLISEGKLLREIVNFTDQQVFDEATTYTCLLFLSRMANQHFKYAEVRRFENQLAIMKMVAHSKEHQETNVGISELDFQEVTSAPWHFGKASEAALIKKLLDSRPRLSEISSNIFVGTQTSADDVFVLRNSKTRGKEIIGYSDALKKEVRVESDVTRPFLRGKEIRKWREPFSSSVLICPYEIGSKEFKLIAEKELANRYPMTFEYLRANKLALSSREKGRFKGGANWYAFGYPKSMTLFQQEKIIVPDYNNTSSFTLDANGNYFKTGYGVILKDKSQISYALGILNSKLVFWFLSQISTKLRGGYVRFWTQYINQIPIVQPETDKQIERAKRISELAVRLLEINKNRMSSDYMRDETAIREGKVLEEKIDRLVYEQYGLTDDEIKVVEESL